MASAGSPSVENAAGSSETPSQSAFVPKRSNVNFTNIGGMDKILEEILPILMRFKDPSILKQIGISFVPSILLHGLPGCGKTYLAHEIAGEMGVPIIEVSATELVHGISEESESKIQDFFAAALATGRCVLFIDEIDALCCKRETNEDAVLGRMVTQMIKSFDDLSQKDPDGKVTVICATSRADCLDSSLRQGLRFFREIAIGLPNEEERIQILKVICKNFISSDFDFPWIAHHTQGYVAADLEALASIAKIKLLDRIVVLLPNMERNKNKHFLESQSASGGKNWFTKWFKECILDCPDEEIRCTVNDFKTALKEFVPRSKNGYIYVPYTTWDDIFSFEDIKQELQRTISWRIANHKFYEENKEPYLNKGILLYGPNSCGKILYAKAIANECNINFFAVNWPALLTVYDGEKEKAIKKCFERARNSAPCILFFDEFDALCLSKSSSKEESAVERAVNQLLTEPSGISGKKQVFLIAATSRLDQIDSEKLMSGHLFKFLYVRLPSPAGRLKILTNHLKRKTVEEGLELEKIAFDPRCEHFSGADLLNLVNEAFANAVKEKKKSGEMFGGKVVLCMRHFNDALTAIKPFTSEQDRRYFAEIGARQSIK